MQRCCFQTGIRAEMTNVCPKVPPVVFPPCLQNRSFSFPADLTNQGPRYYLRELSGIWECDGLVSSARHTQTGPQREKAQKMGRKREETGIADGGTGSKRKRESCPCAFLHPPCGDYRMAPVPPAEPSRGRYGGRIPPTRTVLLPVCFPSALGPFIGGPGPSAGARGGFRTTRGTRSDPSAGSGPPLCRWTLHQYASQSSLGFLELGSSW